MTGWHIGKLGDLVVLRKMADWQEDILPTCHFRNISVNPQKYIKILRKYPFQPSRQKTQRALTPSCVVIQRTITTFADCAMNLFTLQLCKAAHRCRATVCERHSFDICHDVHLSFENGQQSHQKVETRVSILITPSDG